MSGYQSCLQHCTESTIEVWMTFALQTPHILHLSLVLVGLWTMEVEKQGAGPTYPSFLQSHDEMHGVFCRKEHGPSSPSDLGGNHGCLLTSLALGSSPRRCGWGDISFGHSFGDSILSLSVNLTHTEVNLWNLLWKAGCKKKALRQCSCIRRCSVTNYSDPRDPRAGQWV